MPTNRLAEISQETRAKTEISATAADAALLPSSAFVACPEALMGGFEFWQQCLYRIAYQHARTQVAARREARNAAAMWN